MWHFYFIISQECTVGSVKVPKLLKYVLTAPDWKLLMHIIEPVQKVHFLGLIKMQLSAWHNTSLPTVYIMWYPLNPLIFLHLHIICSTFNLFFHVYVLYLLYLGPSLLWKWIFTHLPHGPLLGPLSFGCCFSLPDNVHVNVWFYADVQLKCLS